jgi:hypothetical protein
MERDQEISDRPSGLSVKRIEEEVGISSPNGRQNPGRKKGVGFPPFLRPEFQLEWVLQ